MAIANTRNGAEISRRRLLVDLGVLAGAAGVIGVALSFGAASAEQAKVAQNVVAYQPTPKGANKCSNCVQWQPPKSCKVVAGVISPDAWCSIWAPKS